MSAPDETARRLGLLERMIRIREFEEGVRFLFLEGSMPGTIHQCQGQEATAVGVCAALRPDDFITSTFRGHGHALAKGLTEQQLLDELFGASTGCCKGKGGSMHVGDMSRAWFPASPSSAAAFPWRRAWRWRSRCSAPTGWSPASSATARSPKAPSTRALNMAAIWRLPAIFVCENNLYGASTRIDMVMNNTRVSDRAAAYGFFGETVDGNDVEAVHAAAARAAARCRAGDGPVLLELLTYRRTGHSRRDPCPISQQRSAKQWAARDPIDAFASRLKADGRRRRGGSRAHARANRAEFRRGGRTGARRAAAVRRRADDRRLRS